MCTLSFNNLLRPIDLRQYFSTQMSSYIFFVLFLLYTLHQYFPLCSNLLLTCPLYAMSVPDLSNSKYRTDPSSFRDDIALRLTEFQEGESFMAGI